MTAATKQSGFLSLSNWLHIAGCAALLLILIFAGVLPAIYRTHSLKLKVGTLRSEFAEHMALVPFRAELVTRESAAGSDLLADAPLVPLGREEFGDIHNMLQGHAEKQDLSVMRVVPQVVTLTSGRYLCAKIMVEGDFEQFPAFIRGIMAFPSFFCLDQITINQGGGLEQLEVVAWLGVKSEGGESP